MTLLTLTQLQTIMPRVGANAGEFLGPINATAEEFAINTPQRLAAFLAQIAVESADLTVFEENLRYQPERLVAIFPRHFSGLADAVTIAAQGSAAIANRLYANRMGNGPEHSGDGYRYRGRGPAQLTGKNEYAAVGKHLVVDLLAQPDRLLEPLLGMRSAGWFWTMAHCSGFADKGDINGVSRAWNGGDIGLVLRGDVYAIGVRELMAS